MFELSPSILLEKSDQVRRGDDPRQLQRLSSCQNPGDLFINNPLLLGLAPNRTHYPEHETDNGVKRTLRLPDRLLFSSIVSTGAIINTVRLDLLWPRDPHITIRWRKSVSQSQFQWWGISMWCIAWLSWGGEFVCQVLGLCSLSPAGDVMPYPLKHFRLSQWGPVSQWKDCRGHRGLTNKYLLHLRHKQSFSLLRHTQDKTHTQDAWAGFWAAQCEFWWVFRVSSARKSDQ